MISHRNAHLCNFCVDHANSVVRADLKERDEEPFVLDWRSIKPEVLKKKLDAYVIGQEQAKKVLVVAVYNHYKRISQSLIYKAHSVDIEKSNVLLIGDTGTGKTYMVRKLAQFLKVPFCSVDATVLTEAGYVGEDIENIPGRLLQAADYKIDAAEKGIVYIDEIDKIARKSSNPSITRDVSGEGVQQGLLKLLEDTTVNVAPQGGRRHPDQKLVPVKTGNILFVCGGSFGSMRDIVARRLNTGQLGFNAMSNHATDAQMSRESLLRRVCAADLSAYGFIPEFVGRLSVIGVMDPLGPQDLRQILTKPKNALIRQYRQLFAMDNVKLVVTDDALDYLVEKALEVKLGARGLRAMCEAVMTDAMFMLPSQDDVKEWVLDKPYMVQKLNPSLYTKQVA